MANYRAGDVIRLTRNAVGMTQEQLSEGICSVETLSRLENGKHAVKQSVYERLMARMERDTRKSYAVCVSKDMELMEERIWLEDAVSKHEYERAEIYLDIVKRKIEDSCISRQYVERMEGVVSYRLGRIGAEELVKKLENAIRITVPNYECHLYIKNKELVYPFTELEIYTLMSLASAYEYIEQPHKSIQIYETLLLCLKAGYMDENSAIKLQMVIGGNYGKALERAGKYREALEKAGEVLNFAIINDYGKMIPPMLLAISWDMRKICKDSGDSFDDIEHTNKRMLRQAYYIAAARKDNVNLGIIKKYYSECFGEEV